MRITEKQRVHGAAMKLTYGGVLTAIGVLLPQAFHMFGQNAGMVFLPIQIPVLLAGVILGSYYGLAVGMIVPVLSCLLTGMPPVPKVYFMIVELAAYGVTAGWMFRKYNIYVSLAAAMIVGRLAYGGALAFGVYLLHMNAPFMNMAAFTGGILSGVPGILLQLLVIPVLYFALKKGGLIFEA